LLFDGHRGLGLRPIATLLCFDIEPISYLRQPGAVVSHRYSLSTTTVFFANRTGR